MKHDLTKIDSMSKHGSQNTGIHTILQSSAPLIILSMRGSIKIES